MISQADHERAQEAQVAADQHQQEHGHGHERAGGQELVHVAPRHPARAQGPRDHAGSVDRGAQHGQRDGDAGGNAALGGVAHAGVGGLPRSAAAALPAETDDDGRSARPAGPARCPATRSAVRGCTADRAGGRPGPSRRRRFARRPLAGVRRPAAAAALRSTARSTLLLLARSQAKAMNATVYVPAASSMNSSLYWPMVSLMGRHYWSFFDSGEPAVDWMKSAASLSADGIGVLPGHAVSAGPLSARPLGACWERPGPTRLPAGARGSPRLRRPAGGPRRGPGGRIPPWSGRPRGCRCGPRRGGG